MIHRLTLAAVLAATTVTATTAVAVAATTDPAGPAVPSLTDLESTLAQGHDVPRLAGTKRISAVGVDPFLKAIEYTDKDYRRMLRTNDFVEGSLRNFRPRKKRSRTTEGLSETLVFETAAGAEAFRQELVGTTRRGTVTTSFTVPGMPYVTAKTNLGRSKGRYVGGGNVTWVQGTCVVELGVFSPDTGRGKAKVLSAPLVKAAPKVLRRVTPVCGPAPASR